MSTFGSDLLESWGFDGVAWSDEAPPVDDGEPILGYYDSATQTIHLDPDFLCQAEGMDVANIVAHEVYHAAEDQAGWDTGEEGTGGYAFGQDTQMELEGQCTSTESGSIGEMPDLPWVYEESESE